MKIQKQNFKQNKLFKINIIKTQLYKNLNNHCLNLNDIIFRFKQALQIIYKYHINNKKILFVGFPYKIEHKFYSIMKNNNHVLIPNSFWINGLITNPKKCLNYLFSNPKLMNTKMSEVLFLLNSKVDLIVLLNSNAEQNVLNESFKSKIPVIYLQNDLNAFDSRPTYKIPGNVKFSIKNSRNNFFYFIIYSLFKKAQQNKILNTQFSINTFPNQKLTTQKEITYNKYKKPKNFQTFK